MNVSMYAIALTVTGTLLTACAGSGHNRTPPRAVTLNETVRVQFGPNTHGETCAVAVAPNQSDCPPGLADPQTICRAPGDDTGPKGKAIKWEKANPTDPDFEILQRDNRTPCRDNSPRHECHIRDGGSIGLPNRPGAMRLYKYDVTVAGCRTPLDPYIIITR
jgi:hypothetical protein